MLDIDPIGSKFFTGFPPGRIKASMSQVKLTQYYHSRDGSHIVVGQAPCTPGDARTRRAVILTDGGSFFFMGGMTCTGNF